MSSPVARSPLRGKYLAAFAVLAMASAAYSQNGTWSGGGTDAFWSDVNNWVSMTPPTTGTASFNGNTLGNLGTFNDNTNLGLTGINVGALPGAAGTTPIFINGNAFSLGAGGISMPTANQDLTIGANLSLSALQTWTVVGGRTLTIGATPGSNTLALSTTAANTLTIAPTGVSTTIINGNIVDGAASSGITINPTVATAAIIRFLGTNTYTGGTTIMGRTEIVQIGSNSALGTGPITTAPETSGSVVPQFQAFGGPQTIGNSLIVNFGFQFGGSNNLTFTGPVTLSTGRAITYNGAAGTVLTFNGPVTIGTAGAAAGSLTTSVVSGTTTATGTIVFNGVISEAAGVSTGASITLSNGNGTAVSSDQFNNQNTFSGGIDASGGGATIIAGASTTLSGSTIVSGPFGTGTVTAANANTPIRLQAANGAQTVANNFTLANSFQVQGSNNITLSGVLTGGGSLIKVGSGTLTLTAANAYSGTSLGTTISGGTVLANNATGSATGTSIVSVIGTGTVGSGGTLGGGNSAGTIGFISGNITISAPAVGATSGGTLAPGPSATLTATGTSMVTWNPLGTYQFAYDSSAIGTAPLGGASTLLEGTGTSSLNLTNLTTTTPFTLNLVSLNNATSSSPVTYTIADFSTSTNAAPILPPTGLVGTDLTPYFTVTGAFQASSQPIVTLNNGNQVTVTIVPVPEPTIILAACGGLTALTAGWRRVRRRADFECQLQGKS